ncbi:LysR family transcriptional regulator [Pantoea dispersa]|uniref:LysR family transcriptional regulator n=1 Tax=Pantoea dispersa TaxID=59814 RepID=UPI0021AFBD59|nr:LysR family transcriptional regulator [Pantoea dispersa]MCT6592587.1 LysR family transcriptional regulator [Pantoea dispersa]MCW0323382.1 HTH-type transcriptional regulator GltC [Pantoea dispersa]MCW0328118.1 HTH-type transcriptional regulator GltC [Pantoea dispersa]MCW0434683.1 HTH-type transcriptional regulator GltC [Pantoea dispersa]
MNISHFDLNTLRLFVTAADCKSLTRTAEISSITLSAVSKRISELERNVNCQLFVRQPRGLELTTAGLGLLRHARALLDNVNSMASELNDYARGAIGHVRIGANVSAVIQFLPEDLAAFFQSNPGIKIYLEEALSDAIVDSIDSGRVDIGIFADNVDATALRTFPWRQDRLVLLVPTAHPLAMHNEIWFEDTLAWDYVALNQGSSLLRRITDTAASVGRLLKVSIQVTSFDAVCRMIQAGLGIGILPLNAITPALLGTSLKAITLKDEWSQRTLRIGINAKKKLHPEASKLLDFLMGVPESVFTKRS